MMSRFLSEKYKTLVPYVPGEQPRDMKYVKLNTNESPFPPSARAVEEAEKEAARLNLYSDPECTALREVLAKRLDVKPGNLLITNGSDEILNFAFMSYCDDRHPAAFADITYGFYPVFADINRVPYTEIPLKEDFSIDCRDYLGIGKTVFIANPNAPTGMVLPVSEIEEIIKSNPDNIVVVDEAYVDFGNESCIPLIKKYDNLIVTQTFSKSRAMAGARLGYGVACEALINDMNSVKYSTNPYNVNKMSMAAGLGSILDDEYNMNNCKTIVETRAYTVEKLKELGFEVLPSGSNFVFAKNEKIDGGELYEKLKKRGVLIRHFTKERIRDYNRITIGTREQMDIFLANVSEILKEAQK